MIRRLSRFLSGKSFSSHENETPTASQQTNGDQSIVSVEAPRFSGPTPPHILAFDGNLAELKEIIAQFPEVVQETFEYNGIVPLLSRQEISNTSYIPPPLVPRNVRAALTKGDVKKMTLDDRYVLAQGFHASSLLHYACAGNQLAVVRYLIEVAGADRHIMNGNLKPAEYYTDNDSILEYIWSRDRRQSLANHHHDTPGNSSSNLAEIHQQQKLTKARAALHLQKLQQITKPAANSDIDRQNTKPPPSQQQSTYYGHHDADSNSSDRSVQNLQPFQTLNRVNRAPIQTSAPASAFASASASASAHPESDNKSFDTRQSSHVNNVDNNKRRLSQRRMSRVISARRRSMKVDEDKGPEDEDDDGRSQISDITSPSIAHRPMEKAANGRIAANSVPKTPLKTEIQIESDKSKEDSSPPSADLLPIPSPVHRAPLVVRRLSVNAHPPAHVSPSSNASRLSQSPNESPDQLDGRLTSEVFVVDEGNAGRYKPLLRHDDHSATGESKSDFDGSSASVYRKNDHRVLDSLRHYYYQPQSTPPKTSPTKNHQQATSSKAAKEKERFRLEDIDPMYQEALDLAAQRNEAILAEKAVFSREVRLLSL